MKTYRTLTTIGGLFLTASLALAQYTPAAPPTPPTPPAYPAPQAMPAPAVPPAPVATPWPSPAPQAMPLPAQPPTPWPDVAPMAAIRMAEDALDLVTPMPPMPAMPPLAIDIDAQVSNSIQMQLDNLSFQKDWTDAQEKAIEKAQEKMATASTKMADKFNFDALNKSLAMQARTIFPGQRGSDDSMYQNGLNAIDNHQYDQALSEFNNVVAHAGVRSEGALYWKAYVLNKLGRAADAQAAIDTLRKTYPSSRWLDDAKALELEVKQSKGPVSPESETDEDIKILALNGLMQSDPEKALPQVENMLKGSHSPRLKRQALIVIGQSSLPKAQQDLEQIARGGNPDLQVRAIQYLAQRRNPNTAQILVEIYTSSNDPAVKRAVLSSLSATRDKDHLLQLVMAEKDPSLRGSAIRELGNVDGQPELWQIYQSETTPEGKISVLNYMHQNGNLEKLTEVARTDKDPKVRQEAIRAIASQQAGTPSATLVSLFGNEQDEKVKQTIIDSLSNSRSNCKPLVDVAKSEKDMHLKLRIVQRLSEMTKSCPAANDYLMEILAK
jgi:HEAT repeat protein